MKTPAQPAFSPSASPPSPALPQLQDDGGTVYLIEADAGLRDTLGLLLSARGHRAALFGSAEDFIAAWQANWHGCVLADMQLPGMDGLALQRRLAEIGCELPVIMLGAATDFHAARAAFRAHAVDVIDKPMDPARLFAAVEEAMARAQALRMHRLRHEEALARLRELARAERQLLEMGTRAQAAPREGRHSAETAYAGAVLVLERHPLMRAGLTAVLRGMGVGQALSAGSLQEGLAQLRAHPVRLVITDLELEDANGLATLHAIRTAAPGVPVMVTAQQLAVELARECFFAGARGFLDKGVAPDQMAWAIEVMLRGGQFLPEALTTHLATPLAVPPAVSPAAPAAVATAPTAPARQPSGPAPAAATTDTEQAPADCPRITGRQRDVARLIAAGLSNKEIARELGISLGTAKNYVAQILNILGAKTRSRAATLILSRKAATQAAMARTALGGGEYIQ